MEETFEGEFHTDVWVTAWPKILWTALNHQKYEKKTIVYHHLPSTIIIRENSLEDFFLEKNQATDGG